MTRIILLLVLLGATAAGCLALGRHGIGPIVITREDEQKLVLFFGNPDEKPTSPGLSFRWPIVEEVLTFDRRLLHLNSEPHTIQTRDRERIVVDNYIIWRIADPLLFYKSFPTGMVEAETQIDREVRAKVREVIGKRTLPDVVTLARDAIMREITAKTQRALALAGIEVQDVRINRTELPPGTEENVYARMRAERNRLARKHRAEGEEQARRIRAVADRNSKIVVAEANRKREVERGMGDAESARIYSESYGKEPEFYAFFRSLEAYRNTIGARTTLVLPPDHTFLRFLQGDGVGAPP